MIYLDTSSLLKIFLVESETAAVRESVYKESLVIVSRLAELEAMVQLRGLRLAGKLREGYVKRALSGLDEMMHKAPFHRVPFPEGAIETGIRQHGASEIHCRSLDRLHLAAMEELGCMRLMTHDGRQAEAARELGYAVDSPGVG